MTMQKTMTSLISCKTSTRVLAAILCFLWVPAGAHKIHEHKELTTDKASVRAHLEAFRITGDDVHLDEAWHDLEPQLETGDPTLLLHAALVAQARHEFDRALSLTERVLRQQPDNDQAWLLVNAIHLVRANRIEAAAACRSLRRVSILVVMTCHARSADAGLDEHRERLLAVLAAPGAQRFDDAHRAWAFSVAGDLAVREGQDFAAIGHYRRSLALAESAQVRSALVDSLLRKNWYYEARQELKQGSDALPLMVRRLIVDLELGTVSQDEVDATEHRFRQWIVAEDWLHAREMARFYLDVRADVRLAEQLATVNYGIQKEPEDLLLLTRSRSRVRQAADDTPLSPS